MTIEANLRKKNDKITNIGFEIYQGDKERLKVIAKENGMKLSELMRTLTNNLFDSENK